MIKFPEIDTKAFEDTRLKQDVLCMKIHMRCDSNCETCLLNPNNKLNEEYTLKVDKLLENVFNQYKEANKEKGTNE